MSEFNSRYALFKPSDEGVLKDLFNNLDDIDRKFLVNDHKDKKLPQNMKKYLENQEFNRTKIAKSDKKSYFKELKKKEFQGDKSPKDLLSTVESERAPIQIKTKNFSPGETFRLNVAIERKSQAKNSRGSNPRASAGSEFKLMVLSRQSSMEMILQKMQQKFNAKPSYSTLRLLPTLQELCGIEVSSLPNDSQVLLCQDSEAPSTSAFIPGSSSQQFNESEDILDQALQGCSSDLSGFLNEVILKQTTETNIDFLARVVALKHESKTRSLDKTETEALESSPDSLQMKAELKHIHESQWYSPVQRQREKLPVFSVRDELIQTLDTSKVVLVSGETGCGKTTQVPLYLLEDQILRRVKGKDTFIVVAQPRRIAAISVAQRVHYECFSGYSHLMDKAVANAKELPLQSDFLPSLGQGLVGYQVRLDNKFSRTRTKLLFCTTGVLLRRLQQADEFLSKVTHVILDEVHERTVNRCLFLILAALLAFLVFLFSFWLWVISSIPDQTHQFKNNVPYLQVLFVMVYFFSN